MEIMQEIDPVELTRFVRPILDVEENAPGTLADVLPNRKEEALQVEWTISERVRMLAQLRAFDAETPLASGGGMEERIAKLLPLGLKQRFSEYDQLRARSVNSPESVQAAAERKALEVGRASINRAMLLRGEALTKGKLELNENGVIQSVDFLRRPDFTKTLATPLSTGDDAVDPLPLLEGFLEEYSEENGFPPSKMLTSRRVLNAIRAGLTRAGYFGEVPSALVTNESVNQVMTDRGLPTVTINERTAAGNRVIPADVIIFTGDNGMAGDTVWGTPLETYEPEYAAFAAGEAPGLLVGAYRQLDPAIKWIQAAAIALPVLTNPNTTMTVKVV